ncbi:MAG: glycosyltransferase [Cyanobacteria bacterium]|jgi:glycosyltransferase involved in cell wall biosynthesis|nr:glycosyltransferase [Cyanobacteria bacterium GSL.Bin1]
MSEILPIHLGILAAGNPEDIRTWSGVPHFMTQALKKYVKKLTYLPAGSLEWSKTGCFVHRWSYRLFKKKYIPGQIPYILEHKARKVEQLIESHDIDVLLAITIDPLAAHLQNKVPLVHHSDTTFAAIADYYPTYSPMWKFCRNMGNQNTAGALNHAKICTFPSQWAANSAIEDYGISPEKIRVIPYGANLSTAPSVEEIFKPTDSSSCQLLFIGRQWERKGGPIAFATMLELINRGIDANLVVVGCDPKVTHEKLTVIPFLNKQIPEDLERYINLWRQSAFLLMPSHQETFGAIYAEAAANGVPVIAKDTGGVSSCVKHGVSGFLLAESSEIDDYANLIEKMWTNPQQYQSLKKGARDRYENTLNWDAWSQQTVSAISDVIYG